MKKLSLITILLSISFSCFGQDNRDSASKKNIALSIEIEPGWSKFKSNFSGPSNRSFFDYHSYYTFSYSTGLISRITLCRNALMDFGLLFSCIRGNESYAYKDSYADPFVYTYAYWYTNVKSVKQNLIYLNIPFCLGYEIKRISVFSGFQLGYNVRSIVKQEAISCYGLQGQTCENFSGNLRNDVARFDIGLLEKITFTFNNRWGAGTKFYLELNTNNSIYTMKWNYFNFSFLLNYKIKYFKNI